MDLMSKHFKMYITITDIIGEKRVDLSYPIRGKEVAVISVFSDNIQYQIREPVKALLIKNEERQLLKGTFIGRKLSASIEGKLRTAPLVAKGNIIKMEKLTGITEVVLSLDELDNTDNMEDERLSNILLRYHVSGSEDFTSFEPATPQYKKLKNREFASLTLRITNQNDNNITDGLG